VPAKTNDDADRFDGIVGSAAAGWAMHGDAATSTATRVYRDPQAAAGMNCDNCGRMCDSEPPSRSTIDTDLRVLDQPSSHLQIGHDHVVQTLRVVVATS